jgi:uncharacterized membrane protein
MAMTTGSAESRKSPLTLAAPTEPGGLLHAIRPLGGPGTACQAADINDRGDVVGMTSIPGSQATHAYIMNPDVAGGRLTDLTPSDPRNSQAEGINGSGVVVGAIGPSADGGQLMQPFIWEKHTGLGILPLPPGSACAVALDINDAGEVLVVGMTDTPDPLAPGMNLPVGSFLWHPVGRGYTPLPLPDPSATGPIALARGLDERGSPVGGVVTQVDEKTWHHTAVVWEAGPLTPHELSTGGGSDAYALSRGENGLIVGWRMAEPGTPSIAVLWPALDAPPVELPGRVAFKSNADGQIVGIRDVPGASKFPFTAVMWEPDQRRTTTLGDEGLGSYVFSLNASGRSAGYFVTAGEAGSCNNACWWDSPWR